MPHRFELWAPTAHRVEVEVDGTPTPMARDRAHPGWWAATEIGRAHV